SGTLALGISNAIPSNSAVTIGGTFAGGNGGAGTLSMGSFTNAIGSLAFSGSGGTIRFAPTLSQTSTLMLTASGNVNLAGTSTLDLGNTVLTAGLYRLIAGSSLTGQFSGTTGLDSNYFVRYGTVNANEVDLQRKADQAATFTMTAANTRALVNTSVAASGTLTNITPSGGTNLAVSLSSGGPLTANGFSSGTNSLAPGASTAVSGSIQAGATAGTFGWSVLNTDPNAIQTTSTATGSLTVVNQRTFSTSTGTLSLGFVHQGGSFSTPTLTVTSTGLNSVTENATLGGFTGGAAGFSLGRTSGTNVFDGLVSPQQAVYTLSGSTGSLGAISGTYSSTVTREFSGSTSINVAVSGQVYSGQSIWATTTSGTLGWGTLSGTGANAFGLNWGTNQGSPGLDAGFTTTDTATFASALTSGTAVILLNGAAPSLRGITFSNSAGTYDLDVGSGGTGRITLAAGGTSAASSNTLAGFHEIHTELQLGSNLQVAVTGGSGLILHAAISGSNFSLTKADAGLLTVRGNNAYSGGTLIAGGTLALGNSGTPLGSGSVVLTNNSTLDMRGFAIGNTIDATYGFIINPGAANIDITGTATVSGTGGIIGVYTVQPTAVATFTSPLGVLSGSTVAGTITVQGGGTLLTTSTITSNGSILVNTGAVATLTGPVDGTVTTAGATTFSGVVLGAADITVSGGTTTFHGTTFGDVNVDVSGTNTGNATAIFSGTVAKTAHVYASGTITLLGAVAASADVKAETGGVVQLLGTGSFAQPAMTNNGLVVVNRSDYLRMATAISGSGALEKYGSGTLELAGANTFTGQVSANAGRLLVNGNLAAPVYVAPAATLGGSGAIGGFTSIAGIHAPGNSPGLQTFTGGLTYGGTSTFQWELAANTADAADRGVLYDGVNVTDSNLQIDAGATIDLIFSGGLSSVSWADSFWDTNHQWVAIAHAGMGLSTGLFTIGTIGNDINGNPIWVARPDAYFSVLRQGDNIVVAFSAPEPGAITIAAIGLGIVAWRLRRRSRPTPPGDAGSPPPPRSE
ncbi:MAG: beta strand repeat-containing protein, partial [Planctomycetaceae bacterium]